MVRPPCGHTLIKCDTLLNRSQNHFWTQIMNRYLSFNDELHGLGQYPDRNFMFHHRGLSL